jgi:hypothetical protein
MIIKSIFICSVRRSLACFVGKPDLRQLALLQREKQARLEALERGEKSVERKPIMHFREWQVGEWASRQSWRLGGAWHGKAGNNMFGSVTISLQNSSTQRKTYQDTHWWAPRMTTAV